MSDRNTDFYDANQITTLRCPHRTTVANDGVSNNFNCGRCPSCKARKKIERSSRIIFAMQDYPPQERHFITLTYENEHLIPVPVTIQNDWQKKFFHKQVRGGCATEINGQKYMSTLDLRAVSRLVKRLRENLTEYKTTTWLESKCKTLKTKPKAYVKVKLKKKKEVIYRPKMQFVGIGEYGSQYGRPHYHLVILGLPFDRERIAYELTRAWLTDKNPDIKYKYDMNKPYYRVPSMLSGGGRPDVEMQFTGNYKKTLQELGNAKTPIGFVHVGDTCDLDAAKYISGYVAKGLTSKSNDALPANVKPEYSRLSNYLGLSFLHKWIIQFKDKVTWVGYNKPQPGKPHKLLPNGIHEDYDALQPYFTHGGKKEFERIKKTRIYLFDQTCQTYIKQALGLSKKPLYPDDLKTIYETIDELGAQQFYQTHGVYSENELFTELNNKALADDQVSRKTVTARDFVI